MPGETADGDGDAPGVAVELEVAVAGGNCVKIGLAGNSILRENFQENMTPQRPFLLLRISFPGRPIFIQFVL